MKETVFGLLLIVLLVFMVIGPFGIKPAKAVQTIEISYDSGTADSYASPGTNWGFGVIFDLPEPGVQYQLDSVRIYMVEATPGPMLILVYLHDHGSLFNLIYHSVTGILSTGWNTIDLSSANIVISSEFMVGFTVDWFDGYSFFPYIGASLNGYAVHSGFFLSWNPTILNIDYSEGYMIRADVSPVPVSLVPIAVTNITADRTWVYQGNTANINVTVWDDGDYSENATVTLYYNITAGDVAGVQNVTLISGENRTLLFVWNTAGVPICYTNYTITAVATIPTGTNTLTDGNITVRFMGDINGTGTVDISDIAIAALAFGSHPGMPNWNPAADVNGDGVVDIMDIALIAQHFGQHT
jgi:hypothetical protein